MKIDVSGVRRLLKAFDFKTLFREQLGWDKHQAELAIPLDGAIHTLSAVAEKRGFSVYVCPTIPDRPTRLKLDRQVTKSAREHLIIYTDKSHGEQLWEWVRREPGKPAASRDYRLGVSQSGEMLIQKLEALAVNLEEEEKLTIVDVAGRAKSAFDVDKTTKRFYDRFKTEHAGFMKFINGIKHEPDLQWYTSLMLNRLMFVYFIQKKGFLDGDGDYLRNRLARLRQEHGKDKFYSFYRYFLLRLFHEGLGQAQEDRKAELDKLLGKVPFLNGGFFEMHKLEDPDGSYPDIQIPDVAFEKLFSFFEEYNWHLDERPLRSGNEINPDVVGYIFEKYINQKQMGAYYTKEDITEYISKNTVIPFLFDAAEKKCAIAFKPDSALWRMLRDDPDRYIYAAVRHGVVADKGEIVPLPTEIEAGVADVSKRGGWNKPAPQPFALPTETWREHVARRHRCLEIREKLRRGEVHQINDLVTLNLDIWQFARDAIVNSEGPELLRAFYHTIAGRIPMKSNEKFERGISVLDPTCGSGAFLFAALRILETLYSDCLERMRRFVDELEHPPLDKGGHGGVVKHRPEKYADFKAILAEIEEHPNERYFVLKSIIINNLFGVDIMEEAVEICKLRLFLKLVAQVDRVEQIEPLPDIDFNIRAGNTLVGYVSLDEVRRSQSGTLGFGDMEIKRIEEDALIADGAYKRFRETQVRHGGTVTAKDKAELRKRLNKLDAELDRYLAGEYGIKADKAKVFDAWKASHQPFHWLVEFFGIMHDGGFDVIIGNPPWVEYATVKKAYTVRGYATERCGNLHTLTTERSLSLRSRLSSFSFIVQLPLMNSSRMDAAREVLRQKSGALFIIPFDDRPGKLFSGLQHCRSVIFVSRSSPGECRTAEGLFTTEYQRWPTETRATLFERIEFEQVHGPLIHVGHFPKYGGVNEHRVFDKLIAASDKVVGDFTTARSSKHFVFYQEATQYWVKAVVGLPYYAKNGRESEPAHGRFLHFDDEGRCHAIMAVLNSSLFYMYFIAYGDCFHLSDTLATTFPLPSTAATDPKLVALSHQLNRDLRRKASRKTIRTKDGDSIAYDEYVAGESKELLDQIDEVIAGHIRLSPDELDFVTNFDFKFRTGGSDDDADEDNT